jgi:ferrochelatase
MTSKKAVLLLAFGGPDSLDDIKPFLENILSGRKLSEPLIQDIKNRYALIGGKSPLKEITTAQAKALEQKLCESGEDTSVYVGMRYFHPYIKDTINKIHADGHKEFTALIMAPQRSGYTVRGYERDIVQSIESEHLDITYSLISYFHSNKMFQEAIADNIISEISSMKNKEEMILLFSAHSLPLKFMGPEDPYVKHIEETVKGVLSFIEPLKWKLAYQSKGMIQGDWLEPSVDSILDELPGERIKNVLIVPVGFVSDHVETLYDIDIVYRKKAEALGLIFFRTRSLNNNPKFIQALAEVLRSKEKG